VLVCSEVEHGGSTYAVLQATYSGRRRRSGSVTLRLLGPVNLLDIALPA
jgi:hypothetical protein